MQKWVQLAASLILVLALAACGQAGEKPRSDQGMQTFFSGKVVETGEEVLVLEVDDVGNSGFSPGEQVEVSREATYADGCPDMEAGEFVRVLTARNGEEPPEEPIEALSIYRIDQITGEKLPD